MDVFHLQMDVFHLQMDVFHLYFPRRLWVIPTFSYHFLPEDVGSSWSLCQPCLVGHSLVVGWGREKWSGWGEQITESGCQGCWKDELTRYMKTVLGWNMVKHIYIYQMYSNVPYVLWLMILFPFCSPWFVFFANLFLHQFFSIFFGFAPRTPGTRSHSRCCRHLTWKTWNVIQVSSWVSWQVEAGGSWRWNSGGYIDRFLGCETGCLVLLMAEILHQLRLVVYPIIYRVSAPS